MYRQKSRIQLLLNAPSEDWYSNAIVFLYFSSISNVTSHRLIQIGAFSVLYHFILKIQ